MTKKVIQHVRKYTKYKNDKSQLKLKLKYLLKKKLIKKINKFSNSI